MCAPANTEIQAIKTIYVLSYLNIRKFTVQKDMNKLEQVEERVTKFVMGLKYLRHKERLCSVWRREGWGGDVSNVYKYLMEWISKRETDFSQQCPVTAQEAMRTDWNTGKQFFTVKRSNTGNSSTVRLQSLHPWIHWRLNQSWTTCSSWHSLTRWLD